MKTDLNVYFSLIKLYGWVCKLEGILLSPDQKITSKDCTVKLFLKIQWNFLKNTHIFTVYPYCHLTADYELNITLHTSGLRTWPAWTWAATLSTTSWLCRHRSPPARNSSSSRSYIWTISIPPSKSDSNTRTNYPLNRTKVGQTLKALECNNPPTVCQVEAPSGRPVFHQVSQTVKQGQIVH